MAASTLPMPSADAQAHSAHLREVIQEQIIAAGGRIPFWKFMELALYAPGLGYYSAGAHKFGPGGDFTTAPERSPLFAACVADALAPALRQAGKGAVFMEVGGGSGAFAEACLEKLQADGVPPARYAILEPSADLRQRQRERLQARLPAELFARVEWLDGPISEPWDGVLFANEVIDALPTPRFAIRAGEVLEECVSLDGEGRFVRAEQPADPMLAAAVRRVESQLPAPFADGYRSEVLAQLPYWLQAVVGGLRNGALLLIDYGYPRAEYYLPSRSNGTLLCYYRHHAHGDPFLWPGLNDITAFVDFTAVAEAGFDAGLDVQGYTTQAQFLFNCGVLDCLARRGPQESAGYIRAARAVQRLTAPQEMGELFKVLALSRGLEGPLLGFARGDRLHAL